MNGTENCFNGLTEFVFMRSTYQRNFVSVSRMQS